MENNNVSYWLELSEYDLKSAKVMFKGARYLYVGFLCHQVIEKALKAYYVKELKTTPPFIHSLSKLAEKSDLYEKFT